MHITEQVSTRHVKPPLFNQVGKLPKLMYRQITTCGSTGCGKAGCWSWG